MVPPISTKRSPETLTLFCRVVDNFGDIGICFRLARQLSTEHGVFVTLWVDDLVSFARLCPAVRTDLEQQTVEHIVVRHWHDQDVICTSDDVGSIVVEFFGCELPPSFISAMQVRRPVWINLEGLSAEDWVEGCHTLTSPQYGMTKFFYYPGFTERTGGLILEDSLKYEQQQFLQDPSKSNHFLESLGVTPKECSALKVSLFCYPHAPLTELFQAWQAGATPITCLVPEGVAKSQIHEFLVKTDNATHGSLTIRQVPFLQQTEYDRLLWSCDVNFVRGEDSFVRAQWAARPFVWHIYPQDKNLHHIKLRAFHDKTGWKKNSLADLTLTWNGADSTGNTCDNLASRWYALVEELPKVTSLTIEWRSKLFANADLASNLLRFVATIRENSSAKAVV